MNPKNALTKTGSASEAKIESVLRAIQESDAPEAIVNELPPHDFLMAYRTADDQQRVDLLAIADKEHVDLLIDLACWPGDIPDIDTLEETLKPLTLSGLKGATRSLSLLEPGLRTLALRRNIIVHLLENRNDLVPAADSSEVLQFPDGSYFLEFPDPDAITDSQRAFFQALSYKPFEYYQKELECIRTDVVSDLEETAYRWRNARLADFGFVPKDEAIAILAPREAEEVRKIAAKTPAIAYPSTAVLTLPVLFRENLSGNDFLDGVFRLINELNDPERNSKINNLEVELTAMTGTFLTAMGTDLGDIKAVDRDARKARNLLALGLFATALGNVEEGAKLVTAIHPTFFVQVGLGLSYPLQKRARKILQECRFGSNDRLGSVFDPPFHATLMCLAKDLPLLWTPILSGNDFTHDLIEPLDEELATFSGEQELEIVDRLLCEAESLESLLIHGLGTKTPLPAETPASVLVMTALAGASVGRDLTPFPLNLEEAHTFDRQVRDMPRDQFVEGALNVLSSPLGMDPNGTIDISNEVDPKRRLALRLIRIGHARLLADVPERSLLVI